MHIMPESEKEKGTDKNFEKSLHALVRALCTDYKRRAAAIRNGGIERRTRMEFVYLNSRIYDAACEIAPPHLCEIFISEIGDATGYAKTQIDCMSEGTYKKYKSDIEHNIVKKLYLA